MSYRFLDGINSPSDLKKLNKSDIPALASEIREFLIEKVEKKGGHLASNLGAVELTLAIHTVFDSPSDHIIFDVGHQSYVHRMLTGRKGNFDNLRTPGGLSGFTLRRESEHDPFSSGHSSTSVSAALGFAEADALAGRKCHTVCVIGDGAYTGGMVHEALNNSKPKLPLVIILNENGMSISSNKGAFARYLAGVRISRGYLSLKSRTKSLFGRIPGGKTLARFTKALKNKIKSFVYKPNYFEELGLYYIGPINGNDYDKVVKALSKAKATGKTCVVHLKTVKGLGYSPAENSPDDYHSVYKTDKSSTYHSVFANELINLADSDKRIVAVTAAMGIGTGLNRFGEKYPERYFDVGIAEAHALTFSAGLAAGGLVPFAAIYSTFLQRGYDSLLHDIALQNLPVKIMIDRAGLAVSDGATHHGIFDVSFISHIPNMTLLAPASYESLISDIRFAADLSGPVAIRYPNASENTESLSRFASLSSDPLCRVSLNFDVNNPPENIFITYGSILTNVIRAVEILAAEGVNAGIILIETIKPYDRTAKKIADIILKSQRVLYVEEGIKNGGAAEICGDTLRSLGALKNTDYRILAIDDSFASPESICDLYDFVDLSPERIAEAMRK
ncbi:MAG: 1-deoxy-D-xylulose-5-phosphate synthase [Clostridia bacterium]|nr:1-deoxy-D-xylulose-5-phosphate synthase [Clostridia bacterium]